MTRHGRTRERSRGVEEMLIDLGGKIDQLQTTARDLSNILGGSATERAPAPLSVLQPEAGTRFQLVFICTGNRFRSPLAEAVVEPLVAHLPVVLSSFGTLDLAGAPPLRAATKEAKKLGLDLSAHRSRTLVGADLSEADLIVGFEAAHVGAAVLEAHAPRKRTFLLTELVELLEASAPPETDDPLERARTALVRADAIRRQYPVPGQAEIPDPFGGSARMARDIAREVERRADLLARAMFGLQADEPGRPHRSRRPLR